MKIVFLSSEFFQEHNHCTEILAKNSRPYVCAKIKIGGTVFAIPLRHHILHKYAFFTVKKAGLYFTKSVVISKQSYVSHKQPNINNEEFKAIKANEKQIQKEFIDYIRLYKKAKLHSSNKHYWNILRYSSLQYFEEYLKDI